LCRLRFRTGIKKGVSCEDALLLSGHLLLDIVPRADLVTASHPAELLGRRFRNFRPANRALHQRFHFICGDGSLGLLENLGRNDRFGCFAGRLASHISWPPLSQKTNHNTIRYLPARFVLQIKPLRALPQWQLRPAWPNTAGISGREPPAFSSLTVLRRPPRCEYISGNVPGP
jgi:hypothetical protein